MSSGRRRRRLHYIGDELGVKYGYILAEVGLRAAYGILPIRFDADYDRRGYPFPQVDPSRRHLNVND